MSAERPNDPKASVPSAGRTLILHYHLFKNAGTSVDAMLRKNFGKHWATREFAQRGRRTNSDDVAKFLRSRPNLVALSSHTARLPLPELDGAHIFPILFLRHPIDRLRSAYQFERKQKSDTLGSKLAKAHSFAGYLQKLMAIPGHRQARNFQTHRLAFFDPLGPGSERERAGRALDALPFVGLVDDYDRSIERLQSLLRPLFPAFRAFNVHMNVTRARSGTVDESLCEIEEEIGTDQFVELCAANVDDIDLYNALKRKNPAAGEPEPVPQPAPTWLKASIRATAPAASTVKAFRTLITELDSVITGMTTLAARCERLVDPAASDISRKLGVLSRRIGLDQGALWRDETHDARIAGLVSQLNIEALGPKALKPICAFIDRLRSMLSILSHITEIASEREAYDPGDLTVDDNLRAKTLNRRLLAYEAVNGRTRLRSAPLRHVVHTTTRCNLRCLTCFQSTFQDAVHHDLADAPFRAMEPAIRVAEQVMVAGTGEPLLSRSAPFLIEQYKRAGVYVEVITNGTTLSRTSRMLAAVDVVLLSFDGGTKESYDAVRRGGTFTKLVSRLGELTPSERKKICLNFVVAKQNVYTSRDCLKLAAELGLGQVHFQEMTAYLPWHDRMSIDDTDRDWFFDHFPEWAREARLAGVEAVCQLVPPSGVRPIANAHDPETLPEALPEALMERSLAAIKDVPVAGIPPRTDLAAIERTLDDIACEELPDMLVALARALKTTTVQPRPAAKFGMALGRALLEERAALGPLIEAGKAMMPHCLSIYAHILVNEDGTTRSCCKVQSRLASIVADDFNEVRNSEPNVKLRESHAIQSAPRAECIGCRDPLRFHFLVELLTELKKDGADISRIRKSSDFAVPASMAGHPLVLELGSRHGADGASPSGTGAAPEGGAKPAFAQPPVPPVAVPHSGEAAAQLAI
jgi:uncharacterized radical SAM superfamily Fe-S cluster-containing enzyme